MLGRFGDTLSPWLALIKSILTPQERMSEHSVNSANRCNVITAIRQVTYVKNILTETD
jgi:hypothetical protein